MTPGGGKQSRFWAAAPALSINDFYYHVASYKIFDHHINDWIKVLSDTQTSGL